MLTGYSNGSFKVVFYALLHVSEEMTTQREVATACTGNSLAAFVTNALPQGKGQNGDSKVVDLMFKDEHLNGSSSNNGEGFKSFGESKSFTEGCMFKFNGEKKKHVS